MGEEKKWRVTNGKKTFIVRQGTDKTGRVKHRDGTSREVSGRFIPEDGDEITIPKGGELTGDQPLFGRQYRSEEID